MSLKKCLPKIKFSQEDKDMINSFAAKHKKEGYNEVDAEELAVRDFGLLLFDEMSNLKKELGLSEESYPDYEPDEIKNEEGTTFNEKPSDSRFKLAPPVESEAFKKWFGDSKVVNEDGSPMVVYHGTKSDFNVFKDYNGGLFFSDDAVVAGAYAGDNDAKSERIGSNIIPVYIKLENPLVINGEGVDYYDTLNKDVIDKAKADGYDGIILKDVFDMGSDGDPQNQYVAFEPTQIKSATGNNGQFDENNPDIRFKRNAKNINFESYENSEKNNEGNTRVRESEQQKARRDTFENAHSHIARNVGSAGKDQQITLQHKNAKEYAQKNNLWVESLSDLGTETDFGGMENRIVANPEDGMLYKSNNLFVHKGDILGYINYIQRHNHLSPKTPYDLVGFQEVMKNGQPWIKPIVKQKFITGEGVRKATQEEIDSEMRNRGYYSNGRKSFSYENGEFEISDLKPANVLFKDGEIFVIDDISKKFSAEDMRFKRTEPIEKSTPTDNFYSNSLNSLATIPMEKATGDQWKAMLLKNGGSGAELEWMGFDDFLKNNPKPSKQEVMDFIAANQVEVLDVVKSDIGNDRLIDRAEAEDMFNMDHEVYGIDASGHESLIESLEDLNNYDKYGLDEDFPTAEPTQYSKYQLPGGQNYKEVLLTMPSKIKDQSKERVEFKDFQNKMEAKYGDQWIFKLSGEEDRQRGVLAQKAAMSTDDSYSSSHWDEPNILAHIRFNERYDQDDNKVLFIEEIQSDWAQEGRKKGYKKGYEKDRLKKGDDTHRTEQDKKLFHIVDYVGDDGTIEQSFQIPKSRHELFEDAVNYIATEKLKNTDAVPHMPFPQTSQWINLSMKRMIRYAAENGFDKIAWVTGEQSADRYDLSKQVENIIATPKQDGTYDLSIGLKNNERSEKYESQTPQQMEDLIGKEITQKIINNEGEQLPRSNSKMLKKYNYEGNDLKVGGEGMKSFYDKILPSTASKLLKKFDKTAKVEVTDFANYKEWYITNRAESDPTWSEVKKLSKEEQSEYYEAFREDLMANKKPSEQLSFEVTPALRQKSIQEGMPMFKRNPVVQEEPSKWQELKNSMHRKVLDQFMDLKRIQDAKLKEGGLLDDEMNAYNKETLSESKITVQQKKFNSNLQEPLMDNIKAIFEKTGTKYHEVTNYLKAKHALERNAYMRDKTGAADDAIFGGMSDQEAQAAIEAFEGKVPKPMVKQLHDQVKNINRFTLEKQLKDGLITNDTFDKVSGMYEFYVPLRGYASVSYDPTHFSGFKKAKGRTSESGDPIAYMRTMADTAIIQGEKNKVKQAMLEFVKANPDNKLWNIKNVWFVNSGQVDENGKPIWVETIDRPSQEQFDQGNVKKSYDPDKEVLRESQFTKENLTVLVDGRKVSIEFIGDAVRIGQAFKRLHVDKAPKILRWLNSYMAWLRKMYTQYSPEFGPKNFIRDSTAGLINIRNDYGFEVAGQAAKNIPKAMKALKSGYKGKSSGDAKFDAYFNEYLESGATTGYSDIKSITEHSEEFKAQIEGLKDNKVQWSIGMFKKVLNGIDDFNRVLENTVRLSAYVTLREKGQSIDKSAVYAKELTVNFNKKGEWSDSIGALYLFFNASIQGSARTVTPLLSENKDIKRRAIQTAFALPAMSMALAMLNRIVGGDDEDEESYYDKLPDHVRHHNLIIPNLASGKEGDFLMIPLPYGFNFFTAFGDNTLRAILGKESLSSLAISTVSIGLGSFSPLGSPDIADEDAEWFDHALRFGPTIAQPIVDLALNRNFAGFPVYKEPWISGSTPQPDSQSYFSNVNPIIKGLTSGLNTLTGGDEVVPGYIDMNPEQMEHFVGVFGGGVFTFGNNMATSLAMIMDGKNPISFEEDRIKKVPFIRNYVTSPSKYDAQQSFYENMKEIEDHKTLHRRYLKIGDQEKANQYKKENKEFFRLQAQSETTRKRIENVQKRIKSLERLKNSPEADLRIKELEQMEDQLYKSFNKRFNNESDSKLSDFINN
jgi:hypothetical protein